MTAGERRTLSYPAEEYHQRYLEKHGHPGCAATIR